MQFRLVTYNIHKGIGGVDRRYNLERVVATIAHCAPDILFLQEVDDDVPRSRHHRQVDLLSEHLELPHCAFQSNVQLRQGSYGNAILSRWPLRDVEDVDLTIPFKKRRRGLMAHCHLHINGHRRTLLACNVHLGLAGFERTMQIKRLLANRTISRTQQHTPMILAGDYNDVWGTLGRRLLTPAGFSSAAKSIRTFPAMLPMRALDRIYYRGDLELDHSFASRTKSARQASDHLPLVADFRVFAMQ